MTTLRGIMPLLAAETNEYRGRFWRLLREGLLVLLVVVLAGWTFGVSAASVRTHGDESRFLWNGRYFRYLFLEHDTSRSEWGDNYWTHTQPMLARYIVGGWLWARGYGDQLVTRPYDWSKSRDQNRAEGRLPARDVLIDARTPFVIMATTAILLLYGLGRALGGPLAGLIAAGLAVGSPLVQEHLVPVLTAAPLALFVTLGLLLSVLGLQHGHGGSLRWPWALGVGAAVGLALAAKLTAALSLASLLVWGGLVALFPERRTAPGVGWAPPTRSSGTSDWWAMFRVSSSKFQVSRRPTLRGSRTWQTARGWLLAGCVAPAVFIVSNPHFYPNPPLHIGHMIQQRNAEMILQQSSVDVALLTYGHLHRIGFVLERSLVGGMPAGSRKVPLEAVLALIGAALLLRQTWRHWRQTGGLPPQGFVLLAILFYFGGLSAGMLVAWDRYLVPSVLFSALLCGFGGAAVLGLVPSFKFQVSRGGTSFKFQEDEPVLTSDH